ncbi:MAG: PCI domain-containing protein [Candidatus Odinarchaeum yellowstonii]|uniref:PCI domain-containing protein n=1 Tax=Odinarchaeota yellowstonii (strain LCB_4) TaxID=1841599 RepID=A0AAF0D3A0_ODILC|nr:MAG: PCI domain-containing protein [Candidatus Odinarchaeum yellowstonii]
MKTERLEYSKKPYITTLGSAVIFTFIGVLSLVFNLLGIMFLGLAWWGFWMFIPAFFLYISAAESYIKNKRAEEYVVRIIKAYDGDIYLDKLASELNLAYSDVKAIVVDAISKGKIKARIEASTSKLILLE